MLSRQKRTMSPARVPQPSSGLVLPAPGQCSSPRVMGFNKDLSDSQVRGLCLSRRPLLWAWSGPVTLGERSVGFGQGGELRLGWAMGHAFCFVSRDLQGSAQGPAPRRPRGQLRGRRGLRTSLSEMYPSQEQGMPHGEGVIGAPAGTVVPQELLEEMLWFFRVEDGKWQGTGEWGVCSQHKTQTGLWLKPWTRSLPPRQAAHFLQSS